MSAPLPSTVHTSRPEGPTRGDTVASVAAAWGFTNSSRFTKQYRSVYDESPRETLHR